VFVRETHEAYVLIVQRDFTLMATMILYQSIVNFWQPFWLASLDLVSPFVLAVFAATLLLLYKSEEW
jgi:hypothetical protein